MGKAVCILKHFIFIIVYSEKKFPFQNSNKLLISTQNFRCKILAKSSNFILNLIYFILIIKICFKNIFHILLTISFSLYNSRLEYIYFGYLLLISLRIPDYFFISYRIFNKEVIKGRFSAVAKEISGWNKLKYSK